MSERVAGRIGPNSGKPIDCTAFKAERFWSKVDVAGPDDCWEWQACRHSHGYGIFTIKHRGYKASRVAYALSNGPIAPGALICHKCDNAPCVNPAHLYEGSASDNTRDMLTRGRRKIPNGSNHPNSKLTDDQVREIRRRWASGELRNHLAKEFGISFPCMDLLVRRRTYKDVSE